MEKIVLQVNRLSAKEEQYGKLKTASFFIRGAHVTALLGLDMAGPELFFRVLLGETQGYLEGNLQREQIYYAGKPVDSLNRLRPVIYHYKEENRPLEDWTAAEYIFSDRPTKFLFKSTRLHMKETLTPLLGKYQADLDPMRKMGNLTELERRKAELLRAVVRDAKILLLEDECGGMTAEEVTEYAAFLHRILDENRCAVLLSHTERVFQTLADDIVIFRKGRVVKKAFSVQGKIPFDYKVYLLGNTLIQRKNIIDRLPRTGGDESGTAYGVSGIYFDGRRRNFEFHRGEITTFVILDNKKREAFFQAVSGRKTAEGVGYAVDGKEVTSRKYEEFVSRRIISAARLKSGQEIIPQMSIEDNLFLPSLGKLDAFSYSMENGNVKKSLYREFAEEFLSGETMVRELSPNEVTAMTLERWCIFRPKALICFDVFVGHDPYGISVIQSYMKKIANLGAAVILVNASAEYTEELSDRIIESAQ